MWFLEVLAILKWVELEVTHTRSKHGEGTKSPAHTHRRASRVARPAGDGLSSLIGVLTKIRG